MVRSAATPRVSNHKAMKYAVIIPAKRKALLSYFRRRRCWPSPIFLASCERATA
jgi:hypothetical protein